MSATSATVELAPQRGIVITGASTGIGRASALALDCAIEQGLVEGGPGQRWGPTASDDTPEAEKPACNLITHATAC